jgi:hypothetical protein
MFWILDLEREVTVDICLGRTNDTIAGVNLDYVSHHNRSHGISNGTRDNLTCFLRKGGAREEEERK